MTTKKRFIELHGEAAWVEERKRRNKWGQDYKKRYPEKVKEGAKKYYEKRKQHYKELQEVYIKTPRGRAKSLLGSYKRIDKEKGLVCTLSQDWIIENIFNSSCVYCGESDWRKLGCDRIDNDKGHTPDNVVCSCLNCNAQRKNDYTVEEFIKHKQKGAGPITYPTAI